MQTRKGSVLEVFLNIGSGFIVAMITWQLIAAPLFGYTVTLYDNFWLTSIFTVVSVIRSYIWRRVFNYYIVKKGQKNDHTQNHP